MTLRLVLASIALFGALTQAGCSRHDESGHAHPHPHGGTGSHSHEPGASALEPVVITHFSETTELFVE